MLSIRSSPLSRHAGQRILIVDDVPANLSVLLDVLQAAGFRVFVAESGVGALEQASFVRPDIILLDVMMPGLDGFETCRRLKSRPELAETPLFFMTALNDTSDKLRGFEVGAVDYIGKPLHPQEVLARIEAHLEIRALHKTLEEKNAELEDQNERLDQAIQLRIQAENEWAQLFDQAIVIVNRDGRIQFRSGQAVKLLAKYFPNAAPDRLPPELFSGQASPLRMHTKNVSSDEFRLLILEVAQAAPSVESLRVLGLTPRETETLFWIAQGKTSPEIAIILDTSIHTIKKHVQKILPKLGVETRLAAALKASELLTMNRRQG